MKTTKRGLMKAFGAAAIAATLPAAPAFAQGQPLVLKMAHVYNPGNIWFETAEAYAKAVEAKSGGKVKIQIAASGSTGDWPACSPSTGGSAGFREPRPSFDAHASKDMMS
jgi:TRAP-type C4-dicarboxylate transport system substrate-binding protein